MKAAMKGPTRVLKVMEVYPIGLRRVINLANHNGLIRTMPNNSHNLKKYRLRNH